MVPPKLPRATLEQKIQILDFYHQSNRPQSETVDQYKDKISISTSSFSEWLKNEDELRERLNQAGTTFSKNSRRKVKFKYEKINQAMDMLVKQKLERHEPINEPILREYWSIYAHQYGVDDPKRLVGFSHGWLSQFKKRHGLNKKRMSGSSSVSSNHSGSDCVSNLTDDASSRDTTNAGDIYDPNFSSNGNDGTSQIDTPTNSTHLNRTTNRREMNRKSSSPGEFGTSASAANTYDLMNPQATSNTQGNQFRPQQGLSFSNSPSNLAFSNYSLYQQQQQQQQQGSAQHNQPQNYSDPNRKDVTSNNTESFDYQSQLRAHYEKRKQQLEQSQAQQENKGPQGNSRVTQRNPHPLNGSTPSSVTSTAQPDSNISSSISASDIERFIYIFADRFFHDHQYEYPHTIKVFQEFKNSFFNERIINLRLFQQQQQQSSSSSQPQHPQHPQQPDQQPQQQHQLLQTSQIESQPQLQNRQQFQQMQQIPDQQHISGIDNFFLRVVASHQSPNNGTPPVHDESLNTTSRQPMNSTVIANAVNGAVTRTLSTKP